MSNVSLLNRNVITLQMDQTEASNAASAAILDERKKQAEAKLQALNGNQEAAGLRGEAENIKAGCNAAAAGIGVAAAVCACFPPIGTIIAAILAVVAAIVVLIGMIAAKAKEDEAAAKEKQAGIKDMLSDQSKTKVEDIRKKDDDRKTYVDQLRDKITEETKEQTANAKF